jgi:membrane protease YdiL (CAAX protease family)
MANHSNENELEEQIMSNYNYKPVFYFLSTFFLTYVLWFAGAYVSFQDKTRNLYMLLMLPGLTAPFFISVVMIWKSKNSELKKDFVNRLVNLRLIRLKMLPAFFLIMPLSVILSILLSLLIGEPLSQFRPAEGFSFSSGFVPVLLLLLLAATFEELGWRGYAFDSLQSRYNYLTASIIFSLLWSLWHFPLIFVNGSYQYEIFHQNFWFGMNFFASIIPMGVIISWVCLINGKSVIAAIVFHFIINMSQEALEMSQVTKCIQTAVLLITAAVIITREKEIFLSKIRLGLRLETLNKLQPLPH